MALAGAHNVDVTARMQLAGLSLLWAVECKWLRRRVPKEYVLTFLGVTEDVGADRGLIFSESGFQAGAIRTEIHTNVTLTSVADFIEDSSEGLVLLRIKELDRRASAALGKFYGLCDLDDETQRAAMDNYDGPKGLGGLNNTSRLTARIAMTRQSLELAQFNRWPVCYYQFDRDVSTDILTWDTLLLAAGEQIEHSEKMYQQMTANSPGLRQTP